MPRVRSLVLELPPAWFSDPADLGESEQLLRDLLGVTVRANLMHLAKQARPVPLYESGVRWSRPEGARLSSIPAVLARGRAACASLSCYRAAELIRAGYPAAPSFDKRYSAAERRVVYHVVVSVGDGTFEDPSARCGMPRGG